MQTHPRWVALLAAAASQHIELLSIAFGWAMAQRCVEQKRKETKSWLLKKKNKETHRETRVREEPPVRES